MKRLAFGFLFACTLLCNCIHAHESISAKQKIYYVSPEGNDNNAGTKTKPFKSIARINKLSELSEDTICLEGGKTFTGTLLLKMKGSKNKPSVIISYGIGRPTIYGNLKEAIILSGNNFILKDVIAKGKGRKQGNTKNGILLIDVNKAIVDHVRTEGFQKSGIEVYKCSNVVLQNVLARYNGSIGISITESKNCMVKDSRADDNPGDPSNLTNHSGNGILVGNSDSILIDHCAATNNGWDMPRIGNGPVGIWTYESNHVTIQYCISYRNRTSHGSADGGGFDLDGGVKNSVVQYCLSYENEGSGYGLYQYSGASNSANNTIRYCISINDGKRTKDAAGILIWNGSNDSNQLANCTVYNNIIYNDAVPVVNSLVESANKRFEFFNNIFIGTDSIVNGPSSGDKFKGNIWWNSNGKSLIY